MSTLTKEDFDALAPGDEIKSIGTGYIYKVISLEEAIKINSSNETGWIRECYDRGCKLIIHSRDTYREMTSIFVLYEDYFISHCAILNKKEPEEPKITFIFGKED